MNAKDIWQEIKNIKGHPTPVKTLLPNQEANNLARHFATRAAHDKLPEDVKHSLKQLQGQRRQSVLQAKLESTDIDVPLSINELEAVLRKKKDSAPGEDTFTFSFYTNIRPSFKKRILDFINKSWTQGRLPVQWKTAVVIPIPKPGGRGHRPISLFPTLSKIMERLILSRLLWNLPKPNNLFGFTKGRSTVDAILHLVNLITYRRRYNKDNKKNIFNSLHRLLRSRQGL